MPEIASSRLLPNGDRLLTPALEDLSRFVYRITLEGVFTFAYRGTRFDALYAVGSDGAFNRRHQYLDWTPAEPPLESEDVAGHRYVFRVPAERRLDGQSVGVRVNIDRFVNEEVIPPSDVRAALSGDLRLGVLRAPLAPANPWPALGAAAVPAVVAAGVLGMVIRRRMALRGLSADLLVRLDGIEQQYCAARAAVREEQSRQFPLAERLTTLRRGAFELAREIERLRGARRLMDPGRLQTEIAALRERLPRLSGAESRREAEAALAEKQKSALLLDDMLDAETLCHLRLERIEAVLAGAFLSLRGSSAAPGDYHLVCASLDAEVAAIREVARELPSGAGAGPARGSPR